eukprot:TRINITY_DN29944_c0_g1_i1.p1 TRINITY_DN29944_c0_g1~~TRINITY_DN29944_c0_g1_i1.p1  ORF type:complete len:978 (+),score=229.58 TRINITY_DN29944_c0_g1_i1:191-3124(+)
MVWSVSWSFTPFRFSDVLCRGKGRRAAAVRKPGSNADSNESDDHVVMDVDYVDSKNAKRLPLLRNDSFAKLKSGAERGEAGNSRQVSPADDAAGDNPGVPKKSVSFYSGGRHDERMNEKQRRAQRRKSLTPTDMQLARHFSKQWHHRLNGILNLMQFGSPKFYRFDLGQAWLSVDSEDLKLDRGSIYRKFNRDISRACLAQLCCVLWFPIYLIVGVPFWLLVHQDTDINARIARRKLLLAMETVPVYLGVVASILIFAHANGYWMGIAWNKDPHAYSHAMTEDVGCMSSSEMFAPFKAAFILIAVEVIMKQFWDMGYLESMIRHRMVIDEISRREVGEASFGSVQPCGDAYQFAGLRWLLAPTKPGTESRTRLELHRDRLEAETQDLQFGTGLISELAAMEGNLFDHQLVANLHEHRQSMLEEIEAMLEKWDMQQDESEEVTLPIDFGRLLEVLCAGYPRHFEFDCDRVFELPSYFEEWDIPLLAIGYALLPFVYYGIMETDKLTSRTGLDDVPIEVVLEVYTSCICSVLMLGKVLLCLRIMTKGIKLARQRFIILQRMAAQHHKAKATVAGADAASPATAATPPGLGRLVWNHERDNLHTLDDLHAKVEHKHSFDNLMAKEYGVRLGAGARVHCRSFVELDLHQSQQLRMWWCLRRYIQAGMLDAKVGAELILFVVGVIFICLLAVIVSFWMLSKKLYVVQLMTLWEVACIGWGVMRCLEACSMLNSVLRNDCCRLAFIRHDLVLQLARNEADEIARELAMEYQGQAAAECHECTRAGWMSTLPAWKKDGSPTAASRPQGSGTSLLQKRTFSDLFLKVGNFIIWRDPVEDKSDNLAMRQVDSLSKPAAHNGHHAPRKHSLNPSLDENGEVDDSDLTRSLSLGSCSTKGAASELPFTSKESADTRYQAALNKLTLQYLQVLIDHIDRDYHPMVLYGVAIDNTLMSRFKWGVATGIISLVSHVWIKNRNSALGDGGIY